MFIGSCSAISIATSFRLVLHPLHGCVVSLWDTKSISPLHVIERLSLRDKIQIPLREFRLLSSCPYRRKPTLFPLVQAIERLSLRTKSGITKNVSIRHGISVLT